MAVKSKHWTWGRYGKGYEVSSQGDRRFSAMFARMPDGRTIEQHYQCDGKAYDPGGTNWRLGKGKPGLCEGVDLWVFYLGLWRTWAGNNLALMRELYASASVCGCRLTDQFATTDTNQARALAHLLGENSELYSGNFATPFSKLVVDSESKMTEADAQQGYSWGLSAKIHR